MPNSSFTNINFLGACIIILMSAMTIILSKRYAAMPMIFCVFFTTLGQTVVFSGLHFTPLRLIILAGFIRFLFRREESTISFNKMDKILLLYLFVSFIIYLCLYQNYSAFTWRLGISYNAIGLYFFFRILVVNMEDVFRIIRFMAFAVIPLASFFIIEKFTGRNSFSIFGGVPEFTAIREGSLRCQGPFRHPILAGTFGATLMPLFFPLWFSEGREKLLSVLGLISSTIIMITSASSGPLISFIAGLIGLSMWSFRNKMRIIRWSILLSLVALHMIMKAPVWYLISHVSELIGGGGYHRSELINQAIVHFDEWWLMGTTYTAHWMPYVLPDLPNMVDITNEYIGVGVNGGILSLFLFLSIIVVGFQEVGNSVKTFENISFQQSFLNWSIGAALLAHVSAFISVTYFDQIQVFWYLVLSFIIAAKQPMNIQEPCS